MGGLGKLVTFRGLTQLLQKFIFHEIYPCPAPKYVPKVSGLKKTKTYALDVSKDPRARGFMNKVKRLVSILRSARRNISDYPASTSPGGVTRVTSNDTVTLTKDDIIRNIRVDLHAAGSLIRDMSVSIPNIQGINQEFFAIDRSMVVVDRHIGQGSYTIPGYATSLNPARLGMGHHRESAINALSDAVNSCNALLGIKAFYSASLLVRDEAKSRALAAAMTELQSIEDALPYEHQKRVRSHIPVGVYNVLADFGQARGANTATILPNDANHARKYGRTVLIRNNILANPEIFDNSKQRFDAVVDPAFRGHLAIDGSFNRTLWHEIGHYLGVSMTADGRDLGEALAEYADLFEEMKSDLVSLHAAPILQAIGYYDRKGLRAHYADGIRRTLQVVRPRPEQPYQNMQLMQFNYFIEHGLIEPRGEAALLAINYDRYHEVVSELLGDVLQLQYAGDYDTAKAFVERWNYWDDRVHGRLAKLMQEQARYRGTMVRYAILEE